MSHAQLNHIPAFDGLRGVAIIGVLLYYTGHCPGGWIGSSVFFTLSGYLITTILLNEYQRNISEYQRTSCVNMRRYYWRRALRLLPALIAVITTAALYTRYFKPIVSLPSTLAAMFYISNWGQTLNLVPKDVLSHTWALAIIGQFYIIWPLGLIWLLNRRMTLKNICLLILTAILIIYCYRYYLVFLSRPSARISEGFEMRVDGILVGCLLAIATKAKLVKKQHRLVPLICLAVIGSMFVIGPPLITSLIITPWLTAAVILGTPHALAFRPLVYLGQISYSLYLWSVPIAEIFQPYSNNIVIFLGTCLTISIFSFQFLEKPFLHLQDHDPHTDVKTLFSQQFQRREN